MANRSRLRALLPLAAIGLAAVLGGCVAYPASPTYGYGYGYNAPYYGGPYVGVGVGGGWHDRDWHDHDWHDHGWHDGWRR